MTTSSGPSLTFELNFNSNSSSSCSMTALLRQSAFPDMNSFKNNNDYTICQSNSTKLCKVTIEYPIKSTWHYLAITSDCNYSVDINLGKNCIEEVDKEAQTLMLHNETLIDLVENIYPGLTKPKQKQYCSKFSLPIETFRFIGPTYFSVKYYFNSNYNRSNALLVRSDKKPYFIEFLVDQANNGGTLNFYLVNNLIYDPGYEPEFQTTPTPTSSTAFDNTNTSSNATSTQTQLPNLFLNNKIKDFNLADIKVMLRVCLLFNSMSMYKDCPEGYELSTQSFTNIFTNLQLNVAYPFMGKWYLAIWKECFNINSKYANIFVIQKY